VGCNRNAQFLNDATFHHNVVFQSILSSCGEDADKLAQIRAPGEPRWETPEKKTTYELTCYLDKTHSITWFKIVVDAETFDHVCLGLDEEVSSIYVHWPEYAWDMKVCATRARLTGFPVECKQFAEHLVSSLAVT